ncbi:MAG: heat shock protein transcriptional repressor HspR [Corynebacterium sp.]|uniref:heat shock protein transcriptional repressor HspR n=1 Tax=unclassified Corynebacterium TaxID=2624378 RepID=UPI0026490E95|nr:helix-turn-helix transcriptional regulator [Corynebacterium sp.]MDN5581888.1 helix-turn-helix transcriptional regulator [Corynebacterium sp.]MDN5719090.1 helix-turn-helix transcriptional regulator [Corynebacterium sp.]
MSDRNGDVPGEPREVFVISVAAEITGMHAQTLRTYDRLGLVSPERTSGGGRRYSRDDIEQLLEIQRLSHDEGVNLAGIKAIIGLQNKVRDLRDEVDVLQVRLAAAEHDADEAGRSGGGRRRGEIVHVPRSTAVVLWEQRRRRGRDGRDGRDGRGGNGSDGRQG